MGEETPVARKIFAPYRLPIYVFLASVTVALHEFAFVQSCSKSYVSVAVIQH